MHASLVHENHIGKLKRLFAIDSHFWLMFRLIWPNGRFFIEKKYFFSHCSIDDGSMLKFCWMKWILWIICKIRSRVCSKSSVELSTKPVRFIQKTNNDCIRTQFGGSKKNNFNILVIVINLWFFSFKILRVYVLVAQQRQFRLPNSWIGITSTECIHSSPLETCKLQSRVMQIHKTGRE